MDYEVRTYKPEDYLEVSRRKFDRFTFGTRGNPEIISEQLSEGMAFTEVCKDGVIACGGVLPIWKGVGEGWAITSDLVCKYPFSFAKIVHKKLGEIIRYYKLDRVQTVVHSEFKTSIKWIERMGFKYEGEMPKYIAGMTYFRYAWIRRNEWL